MSRLQSALRFCEAGNLAEGGRICREILRADPRDYGALQLLGLILARQGEFGEALTAFDRALAVIPNSADVLLNRGNVLFELRRLPEALSDYNTALTREPHRAVLWNNRGNVLTGLGRTGDAIASFSKAIGMDPRYGDALVSRADLLSAAGRDEDSLRDLDKAVAISPDSSEIHYRRAVVLLRGKRSEQALQAFDTALAIEPRDPEYHIGRSMALVALKRHDDALAGIDSALGFAPDHNEALTNRASVLSRLKRFDDALISADRALKMAPESAAAWHNRGTALSGLQRHSEALSAYRRAVSLDPKNAATWSNSAVSLMSLGQHDAALVALARALETNPRDPELWSIQGKALANLNRFPEAIESCEKALAVDPDNVAAQRIAIHSRLRTCDWSRRAHDRATVAGGLASGRRLIDPLDALALFDSGPETLSAARLWMAEECPPRGVSLRGGAPYTHERIRIGYLSTDLRAHAVGFLSAGIFEHHDKAEFETTAFSYGPDDRSNTRVRMEAAFERFIDVREKSDFEVATLVREREIDILVDLNGYTGDMRTGILAFRPAPVQVNFLGYPGTMGSQYVDFIIADRILIPDSQQTHYAEKIIYLPNCYQPNDRKRLVTKTVPSRREAGLPENGFVFCCFNNNYKISPEIFDVWMRLLHAAGNSVLWLLEDNATAAANLRGEAEARGIAPERLVFAARTAPDAHLARHGLADLFLDSLPYNAHTTASDALWMGLPLITCPGNSFQSRVAASILMAAGLPELIAPSLADYERMALRLWRDAEFMSRTRAKLVTNRDACALFDIADFTRNLESAYLRMLA